MPYDNELQQFETYFTEFMVNDIKKALQSGLEIAPIILVTIGIECLGGYYVGGKGERKPFIEFINAFLPQYNYHADSIYTCIRNGLAHDYVIATDGNRNSFLFTRDEGEAHLSEVKEKPGWFYLNRERFTLDFLDAQREYFRQLKSTNELQKNARKRIHIERENGFKRGFLMVFYPDQDEHFGLSNFDNGTDDGYSGITGAYPPNNSQF